jgi:hypothetical protein
VICLWHDAQLRKVINTGNLCKHRNISNLSNLVNQKVHGMLITMVTFVTKVVTNVHRSSCKVLVTFIRILLTWNFLNKTLTSGSSGIPWRQEDRHTHIHTHTHKLDKANGCSPRLFCEHAHKEHIQFKQLIFNDLKIVWIKVAILQSNVPKLPVCSYRTLVFPELDQGAPPLTTNNGGYFLVLHKKLHQKIKFSQFYILSQFHIQTVYLIGSKSYYIFY